MTTQALIASVVVVIIAVLTLIYAGIEADFTPLVLAGLAVLIGGVIAIIKWILWFVHKILNLENHKFDFRLIYTKDID